MSTRPAAPRPADAAAGRGGLLERSSAWATLREAADEVAAGGSATVVVSGRPGTGRSSVLAEAATIARQAGLHVVTAPGLPADPRLCPDSAEHPLAQPAQDSTGAPVAVLVDDAQWAEPPAAADLPALTPNWSGRPVLWVVAGCDPAILGHGGGTPRHALALRPLRADSVRALLAAAYGEEACDALVTATLAATGGNAAVLCGTLRRLPPPAPDPDELAALADQVGRHHIRGALARLPKHVVALVRASAAADGDFSLAQVCELAGILAPYRERAGAQLGRTGLLDSVARPRPYSTLVSDRVLSLMGDDERRELYERAVRLARRDGIPTPVLGRLVAHTRLTDPWVPAALHAAGARARRAGDGARAVAFLERAVDRGASGELRADVLSELAFAQLSVTPEAAERGLRRMLAEDTDPARSATRLLAADLLTLRGGGRGTVAALASAAARPTASAAERRTLLALRELALERGPTGAPTGGAAERGAPEAAARDATWTNLVATAPGGETHTGPDPATAAAGAWRHCATGRGIGEARRLATLALANAKAGFFAPGLAAARVLVITEDMDLARGGLDRIEAEARRRASAPVIGLALLNRAELALRTGDLGPAGELLAEAVAEVPWRHWHPRTLLRLTALDALLAVESGQPDRAESALARGLPDGREVSLGWAQLLFSRGHLDLHTGRIPEATTHLREAGRILLALGCPNPSVLPWRSHLAMAQAATDPDGAARLLAEDLAAARGWSAPSMVGAVHLWTGLTLTGPMALRHLRSAVRVLAGSAARGRYVQALAELAAALLDAGQAANARRVLDDAMAASRAAGGWQVPRAEEVAARFAALPATSRERLSAAQLRVATLAAEGRSNKEISEELAVSLRTVELHLTNSYRALGISGRPDLAAVLDDADDAVPADRRRSTERRFSA